MAQNEKKCFFQEPLGRFLEHKFIFVKSFATSPLLGLNHLHSVCVSSSYKGCTSGWSSQLRRDMNMAPRSERTGGDVWFGCFVPLLCGYGSKKRIQKNLRP